MRWSRVLQHPLAHDRRKQVVEQLALESSPSLDTFIPVVPSCVIAMLGSSARELERDDGRRP